VPELEKVNAHIKRLEDQAYDLLGQLKVANIKLAYTRPPQRTEQEPVAYINVEKRTLEWAKLTSWETPTVVNLPKIPLYTHPPQRTEEKNT
jgi:hypothetical protein